MDGYDEKGRRVSEGWVEESADIPRLKRGVALIQYEPLCKHGGGRQKLDGGRSGIHSKRVKKRRRDELREGQE